MTSDTRSPRQAPDESVGRLRAVTAETNPSIEAFRNDVRRIITNAYYDARNRGDTMERAANDARDGVLALFTDPSYGWQLAHRSATTPQHGPIDSQPEHMKHGYLDAEGWHATFPSQPPAKDARPESTCQRCSRPNPVWFAPNEVWNAVMRDQADIESTWGIVCPSCFAELAEAAGVGTKSAWQFAPERPPAKDAAPARPVNGIEAILGPEQPARPVEPPRQCICWDGCETRTSAECRCAIHHQLAQTADALKGASK